MPAVDRIEVDIVAIDSASPVIARAMASMQQFSASAGTAARAQANLAQTNLPIRAVDTEVQNNVEKLATAYNTLGHSQAESFVLAEQSRGALEDIAKTHAQETIDRLTGTVRESGKATEESGGSFSRFGDTLSGIGKTALGFTAGALLAQFSGDLVSRFEEAATSAERLGAATFQLQSRIGGTAEADSAMIAVFERFGISTDEAQRSLVLFDKNLQNSMNSAKGLTGTSPFDQVWGKLGIAATDATGQMRPLNDILVDVIDKLHQEAQAGSIGADAITLFGRAGGQLTPILANLSGKEFVELEQEAQKLGITLSQDNVDQLRQLALANKDTEEAMAGLNIQLGLLVAPYLTEAAKAIAELAKSMNTEGRAGLQGFSEALKKDSLTAKDLVSDVASLLAIIKELNKESGGAGGINVLAKPPQTGDQMQNVLGSQGLNIDVSQGLPKVMHDLNTQVGEHAGDITHTLAQALTAGLGPAGAMLADIIVPPEVVQKLNDAGKQVIAARDAAQTAAAAAPAVEATPLPHDRELNNPIGAGREAGAVAAAEADAKKRSADLDVLIKAGGVDQEVIQHQINAAKRENIELTTRIAAADLDNIPIKERQLQLQQALLESGNNIRQMEAQAAVERAEQAASPALNAQQDAQFREQELKAQIAARAMSGGGGPTPAEINELMAAARNKPAQDLAALEAQRGVTLAQRDEAAQNRAADLATLPIREEQAQLNIVEGQQNMKIQLLHDEQQAQKDRAEIAVAGLQAELVAIEDINFQLKLKKELQDLNKDLHPGQAGGGGGSNNATVNVTFGDISVSSEMDLEDVQAKLQQAILDGLNAAMSTTPNAASPSQPGARAAVSSSQATGG